MSYWRTTLAAAALLLSWQPVSAHGLAISPSTPLSPPEGYQFLAAGTVMALLAAGILLAGLLRIVRWRWAVPLGVVAVVAFAAAFHFAGTCAAGASTEPPSGLRCPCPVFWGFGWERVGLVFVAWNLTGVLVLTCVWGVGLLAASSLRRAAFCTGAALLVGLAVVAVFGSIGLLCLLPLAVWQAHRLRRLGHATWRRQRLLLGANALIYLAGVSPYIASGALSHGWGGAYVAKACQSRMTAISTAAMAYAKARGKMPEAGSLDELMTAIGPYLKTGKLRYGSPVTTCPMVAAYERQAASYVWNIRYSGMPAKAVREHVDELEPIVTCPCHGPCFPGGDFWRATEAPQE